MDSVNSGKELKAFEVPHTSVDFLEKDYREDVPGEAKLAVLEYLELDSTISSLGMHKFGPADVNNINIEPIRTWIRENWDEEFVYDFSKKTVPISFRNSLAIALFKSKIKDYLEGMDAVEVYVDREVRRDFKDHEIETTDFGLETGFGLLSVDYKSLPEELKDRLVMPIVIDLSRAEMVAKADLLFPEGVLKKAIYISDRVKPPYILDMELYFKIAPLDNGHPVIRFDTLEELNGRAAAAERCIRDYLNIRALFKAAEKWGLEKQIEKQQKAADEETAVEEEKPSSRELLDKLDKEEEEYVPGLLYEEDVTFFDIFPCDDGETKEEVLASYRRLADYGYSFTAGGGWDEPTVHFYMEYDGKMKCVMTDGEEFNPLTKRLKWKTSDEEYRVKPLYRIIMRIKNDIKQNRLAIQKAESRHKKTKFVVEKGMMEALAERPFEVYTGEMDKKEREKIAREAEETVGIFGRVEGEESSEVVAYSSAPFDEETVKIDERVLYTIKVTPSLDIASIFAVELGFSRKNRVTDWFAAGRQLLEKFQGVVSDAREHYDALSILPTNDEREIRRAYRQTARRTHPDMTKDLEPEQILEATEEFMQAKEAYDNLMSRIGSYDVDTLAPTFYLGRISELMKSAMMNAE